MMQKRFLPCCGLLSAACSSGAYALPASAPIQQIHSGADGEFLIFAQQAPRSLGQGVVKALPDVLQLGASVHIDGNLIAIGAASKGDVR